METKVQHFKLSDLIKDDILIFDFEDNTVFVVSLYNKDEVTIIHTDREKWHGIMITGGKLSYEKKNSN